VIANAFDFAACEHDATVHFVKHIVIVPRAAVGTDDLPFCVGIAFDGFFGASGHVGMRS
jgi:hypothetical protein